MGNDGLKSTVDGQRPEQTYVYNQSAEDSIYSSGNAGIIPYDKVVDRSGSTHYSSECIYSYSGLYWYTAILRDQLKMGPWAEFKQLDEILTTMRAAATSQQQN